MTREALLALLGALTEEERQELGIPEPVTPDPVDREEVLGLLADLTEGERSELGIIDPVAPPTLERDDVLTVLADLTDEEREGLGIPEGGSSSLVNLSYRLGLTYTTVEYAGDSPRPPVRYAGVELVGEVGEVTQVLVTLRGQFVQGGETVSVATVTSFDGAVFLGQTASVVLEVGQTNVVIPLTFAAAFVTVLLGTDDGDPRMFRASDVPPNAPASPKCVLYDGTLQAWSGVLSETSEPYMRAFQLDRPSQDKDVNGPADPIDVSFWGETRPAEPAAGMIFGDLSIGRVIWFHPYTYAWVNLDGTPLE